MKHGSITYCLSHTIVLTRRCANECGYCDFKVLPSRPLPARKRLQQAFRQAARLGALEVEITAGEGIAQHPEVMGTLRYFGLQDYSEYLKQCFDLAISSNGRPGLLPVASLGNLSMYELSRVKRFIPCLKILLESTDPQLAESVAHENAPDKAPAKRLETLDNAGQLSIPVTTGLLVGIGESPASRQQTLQVLHAMHQRHGHIQNILIERFKPRPGTPMADWPACPPSDILETVAMARSIFGDTMPITVNMIENQDLLENALEAGVSDFGEVRLVGDQPARSRAAAAETPPEIPALNINAMRLQRLALMRTFCASRGCALQERLPIFPSHRSEKWLPPPILELIQQWQQEESVPGLGA